MRKSLGDFLRKKRREKGLTQVKLSYLSKIPPSEISRIENGKRGVPNIFTLKAIAEALNVPETEFLKEAGVTYHRADRRRARGRVRPMTLREALKHHFVELGQREISMIEETCRSMASNLVKVKALSDMYSYNPPKVTKTQLKAPDAPEPAYSKGLKHYGVGKHEDAVTQFHMALKKNPDHPQSLYFMGISSMMSGEVDRAVDCLSRLVELEAKPVEDIRWALANASMLTGDHRRLQTVLKELSHGKSRHAEASRIALKRVNRLARKRAFV